MTSSTYRSHGRERQQQVRLNDEQQAWLVEQYEAGASMVELAGRFGCHRTTVASLLDAHGVALRSSSLTEEEAVRAIDMYTAGLSLAQVGNMIGASPGTIRKHLVDRGIPRRDRHASTHLSAAYMSDLGAEYQGDDERGAEGARRQPTITD